ncbi:MAG: hypothetical protein WC600_08425 [Desulfobaccales bacterium]
MNLSSSSTPTRPHSRRRGTLVLAASSYLLIALNLVQGVVLVPLYLRHIGEILYGAWLASGSIVSYFSLSDFGLNSVIIQKVAEAYGAKDSPRLARYLGSGLVTAFFLSLLPALAGITCASYLPRLFALPAEGARTLATAFILASCAASLMILGHALGGVVCALQRQLLHGLIWIAATVIGLLITVTLLITGYGLLSLPLGGVTQAGIIVVLEGAVFWRLRKQLVPGASLRVERNTVLELMKPSGLLFLANGSNLLASRSDNLIIGIFLGPRAVLVFDLTKRAFGVLFLLATHFHGALKPALAHFFGELHEEDASVTGLTDSLIHISGVVALVLMGGYVILDRTFVGLWVGSSFYAGDLVVIFIGIYGLLYSQTLVLSNIFFSRGRFFTVSLANISQALLYIVLATVMVRWLGLTGIALAGLVSLATTGWLILWHRYCRDFNKPWLEAVSQMLPLAVVGAGILAIGLLVRQLSVPTTVLAFLFHCGCYLGAVSLWVILVDRRVRGLFVDIYRRRPLACPRSM